jgi:hypothetical protein
MKTTNNIVPQICSGSAIYLFGFGLLLSIVLLSLPSCGLETFDIVPDPSDYDSLMVSTTNGKFDKLTVDSVYSADIVIGVTSSNDTIRFVKGADERTYYFITPTSLPVGRHSIKVNALRTFLTLKVDTITTLGSLTADAVVSNYIRDEVTPNVNYFSPGTPTIASQLKKIRDTTLQIFNTLSANQKKSVAITLLANKNFFKEFNTALRNLRSIPVDSVGPSAVCTGTNHKTYYPCLFDNLQTSYTSLETQGRLLVIYGRALGGTFFYINSGREFRLNLSSNPSLVSGMLQFANLLPKGMIVGNIANQANNLNWIVEANFSNIPDTLKFTHNITDTIPVGLIYRNVRSTDTESTLVGSYVTRFNAFRSWWNGSPLSFLPVVPALSSKSEDLPLNAPEVTATFTLGSSNVTKAATNPSVLQEGFRVRFRIDALTTQASTLKLSIVHEGFTIEKTYPITVQPQF